jgi:SpoVK/Ycf46/Vps4 family AAA+-type ATPase
MCSRASCTIPPLPSREPIEADLKAEILKHLLKAHADGDHSAFRRAAIQLAANESDAGHTRIAAELREIIAQLPSRAAVAQSSIDIAQPRGDLAGLLVGGHREERLKDIVLPAESLARLERVLRENRARTQLESWNIQPSRRLLFYGPPGCGKTLAASVLAGELGVPLMTVRFDGLFSRFLGATANHLKVIFDEMPRRPAVYLFDEFDAIGKSRGDTQEVGEIRRVVTSFLQLMDADRSGSVIIAATNYEELLDHAVFRRFDTLLRFVLPSEEQIKSLLRLRLKAFKVSPKLVQALAEMGEGFSFADLGRACDDAIRSMILSGRKEVSRPDLMEAFAEARDRHAQVHANRPS